MGKIKLSIVVPVWNQEDLIVRALESIPHRDDVEIIVVNDGSTDNTSANIFENLEKFNKNIRMVEFKENQGVANALNAGLELIEGEYYMALGSDDYFITDNLNKFIDEWLNNNYGMVYFNLETNDGSIIETNEKNRNMKVGSMKAYKMSLVDTTRYVAGARAHEDCNFDYIVRNKPHKAAYSNLIVKHYNYPREGSLTDLEINKQLMKTKEQGKKEGNSLDLIIPCHNLEEWIEPCLKSICSQENKLEAQRRAIFICDKCIDNTHNIIEEHMSKSNWDYVILDTEYGSPGEARNAGLEISKSRYIWFIDGDDWLTCDNAIDTVLECMIRDDMDIVEFKIKSVANPDGVFGGGTVWRAMLSSRVIGNLRFNNRQNGEDNDFSWDIWNKPGAKYGKIDFAPYFYNFPRVGSQTWKKNHK